ncbi:MAG: ribonuclease J [Deltaproteobacteria bacterium]|nr:ribonuclease J [Deltaproteobacteria bacterium]
MLKIIPLGGLGEIGLNMMIIEYDQHIIVIDAGLMFPDDYMPGIDMVIPDFSYLTLNRDRVRAVILTHGHEDHIGAMPFLLKELTVPVYGTNFTIELLRSRLAEYELPEKPSLNKIVPGEITELGPFKIEFIRVNHSIIDGAGLAIQTPEGIIIHSGDFKIDHRPVDGYFTDINRFSYYGGKNCLALLSDSTNVEREGYTLSESDVKETLENIFRHSEGRLMIAVFASNIARIQQIINLALQYGRKIALSGKSMKANTAIAVKQGLMNIPEHIEISEKAIKNYPDNEIALITTGSQGEPMSSLTRMANGNHRDVIIKEGDTIILSSRFIPGNERAITSIINNLYRRGAKVIYEKVSAIHSSGHAYQEELKLLINLVRPKYFIPVHGEYRHLVKHIELARATRIPSENTILAENGDTICFEEERGWLDGKVHTGRMLVDGKGLGDIDDTVIRDRLRLAGDGVVIILLVIDDQTGEIFYGPDIISRGFVFEDECGTILDEARQQVLDLLSEFKNLEHMEWSDISSDIKRHLKRYFYRVIDSGPLILPIIIPV